MKKLNVKQTEAVLMNRRMVIDAFNNDVEEEVLDGALKPAQDVMNCIVTLMDKPDKKTKAWYWHQQFSANVDLASLKKAENALTKAVKADLKKAKEALAEYCDDVDGFCELIEKQLGKQVEVAKAAE